MIDKPFKTTLPATGGTPALVSLPTGSHVSDFAIQARGDVDMLISTSAANITAGDYWTVKSGVPVSLKKVVGRSDLTLFYAISGGAEDIVEVLPLRE